MPFVRAPDFPAPVSPDAWLYRFDAAWRRAFRVSRAALSATNGAAPVLPEGVGSTSPGSSDSGAFYSDGAAHAAKHAPGRA